MIKTIRIGLLDTDEDVRFGRKLLFASLEDTEVVFESDGSESDLEAIQESLIDVLVINQKLAYGPGVVFYSELRELSGVKHAPPAIITASYVQSPLVFEALKVGVFDVVSIEQGAGALADAVKNATSSSDTYSLTELKELVNSQPRKRAVDLNFVNLVDQLPKNLATALQKLKSTWQKAELAKLERFDLKSLEELVAFLPVSRASELVLKLENSGLLDD